MRIPLDREKRKRAAAIALCALLLAGCSDGNGADQHAPERPDPLGKKLAGKSDQLTRTDLDTIKRAQEYSGRWNRAATPVVRDYLDPKVSAAEWVQDAGKYLDRMRSAADAMRREALTIEDRRVRRFQLRLANTFQDRLAALYGLRSAVASGDEANERAAQRRVDQASRRAGRMGQQALDLVRPYVRGQELKRLLRQRRALVERANLEK